MVTAARPTVACLEMLDSDWSEVTHQRGWSDTACTTPRAELAHPIIQKAAEEFPAIAHEPLLSGRETISGLTSPRWAKVKVGRWRGAVWVDPENGQAWLCAAGIRREGEGVDFYKTFMGSVQSRGPGYLLPSEADRERLALEEGSLRLVTWERDVHSHARQMALLASDGVPQEDFVLGPQGERLCRLSVEMTTVLDEGDAPEDGLVDVVVQIEWLAWEFADLQIWVQILALAAIEDREQRWDSMPVAGVPTFSTVYALPELPILLDRLANDSTPGTIRAGDVAHVTHRARLTDSSVNGDAVKALCGVWFVPRQDHESKDSCEPCQAIYRLIPG